MKPKKTSGKSRNFWIVLGFSVVLLLVFLKQYNARDENGTSAVRASAVAPEPGPPAFEPKEEWLKRAYAVDRQFHRVYTPCWEGAYGAIGDAYLFAATHDSALLRYHLVE